MYRPSSNDPGRRPPPRDAAGYGRSDRAHEESEDAVLPSRHLWVGNVASDVTEAELSFAFGKYGPLESVSIYFERNYAFVNFKQTKDAVAAKYGLAGANFRGTSVRIEFAKGTKPSRHLWVGGVGASVSKEQLLEAFQKYGEVEEFRFLQDRNCAFVNFISQDDAVKAVEGLNGSRLGDGDLRVDFGKSAERGRTGEGRGGPPRHEEVRSGRPARDLNVDELNEPSACLWVGYPAGMKVDENLLREVFAPYGDVDKVRCFRDRTYAFVQFFDVATATRAKEGFKSNPHYLSSHPRVSVRYSKSEINEANNPYGARRVEVDSRGRPVSPLGLRSGPPAARRPYDDVPHRSPHGHPDGRPPYYREEELSPPRTKRLRTDGHYGGPHDDPYREGYGPPPHIRPGYENFGPGKVEPPRGAPGFAPPGPAMRGPPMVQAGGPPPIAGPGGPAPGFHPGGRPAPGRAARLGPDQMEWHGTLAKSGTPVCRARCYNIGKVPDVAIPEVVNCTARTDLDTLARHVYTTADYSVVCFEPVSAADEAAYRDFMHYLGEKRRAGVAKWGEGGTTLFLVPPSDFSVDVLKVPRDDCLLGVVMTVRATQLVMPGGGSVVPGAATPAPHVRPPGPPSQQPASLIAQYGGQPPERPHDYPPANGALPASAPAAPQHTPAAGGVAQQSNPLASISPEVLSTLTALLPADQKAAFSAALAAAGLGASAAAPSGGASKAGAPSQTQPNGPPTGLPPGFGAPQQRQAAPAVAPPRQQGGDARWPAQGYSGGGYERPSPQHNAGGGQYERQGVYSERQASPLQAAQAPYTSEQGGDNRVVSPLRNSSRPQGGYGSHQQQQYPAPQQRSSAASPPRNAPPSELPSAQLAQLTALLSQQQQQQQAAPQQPYQPPQQQQPSYPPQQYEQPGSGQQWPPQQASSAQQAPPQAGEGGESNQDRIQATFQLAAMLLQQMQQQQGQGGQQPPA